MKDSTFTVHRPMPVPVKKLVGETGEKQRCLGSLLNESPNRYASNVSDVQPLGQLKTLPWTFNLSSPLKLL